MPRAAEIDLRRVTVWREDGVLAGLRIGDSSLPFPGCGLETELGVIVPGARGAVQPALETLLERRQGLPAHGSRTVGRSAIESDRMFDALGSTYRELDHLELNTFYRRSGAAARWNLEQLLVQSGLLAQSTGEVLLHAAGGDGLGSTWSSLHVNVAISDLGYERLLRSQRAHAVLLGYYLPAQLSLAVVDGNGGIGEDGYLTSDRIGEFDVVFGLGTMRPSRALVVDRAERFGNARVMNMLRALSFGRASAAGLVMTQLDCLVCDLMVHGVVHAEPFRLGDPIATARALAAWERRKDAAAIQRRIQTIRRRVVDALDRAIGTDVLAELLPGVRDELDFVDATLDAVLRDDEAELHARCDWARKRSMLTGHLGSSGRTWRAALRELRELNLHWARLDDDALRHVFAESTIPASHRSDLVPAETSSWLLWWLCDRAQKDPAFRRGLDAVDVSWKGLYRGTARWVDPQGGSWPWAESRCESIELEPHRFTRATTDSKLQQVADVDDLFAAFGERHSHYGDYAGRAYGPDHRGALLPDPTDDPSVN